MARTAISKTRRFEVFKRDGFCCAYCGAHPPQVILEIDHIVAVSAGGGNEPENLVTSCFDCNRGKAARSLKAVPIGLSEKAALVAEREEQLRGYNAIMQEARLRLDEQTWEVIRYWEPDAKAYARDKIVSIKRFIEKLGLHEVLEAAEIARAAKPYSDYSMWKYFCGVCWTKIKRMEGRE